MQVLCRRLKLFIVSLPLHFDFSSLSVSILRLCIRFGASHLAPEVSIGFLLRYSPSQRKLQSHINGFLPKWLNKNSQLCCKIN